MVFQGTVLGPLLWLVFFADAARAVIDAKFKEIIFADDRKRHEMPNEIAQVGISQQGRVRSHKREYVNYISRFSTWTGI